MGKENQIKETIVLKWNFGGIWQYYSFFYNKNEDTTYCIYIRTRGNIESHLVSIKGNVIYEEFFDVPHEEQKWSIIETAFQYSEPYGDVYIDYIEDIISYLEQIFDYLNFEIDKASIGSLIVEREEDDKVVQRKIKMMKSYIDRHGGWIK